MLRTTSMKCTSRYRRTVYLLISGAIWQAVKNSTVSDDRTILFFLNCVRNTMSCCNCNPKMIHKFVAGQYIEWMRKLKKYFDEDEQKYVTVNVNKNANPIKMDNEDFSDLAID